MSEPAIEQRKDSAINHVAPALRADDDLGSTSILLLGLLTLAILAGEAIHRGEEPPDLFLPLIGMLIGIALSLWYRPAWRCLGFVPILLTIASISGIITICLGHQMNYVLGLLGICIGIIVAAMLQSKRRFTLTTMEKIAIIIIIASATISIPSAASRLREHEVQVFQMAGFRIFIFVNALALFLSWYRLIRHVYEIWVESWIRVMYQIRGRGIGMKELPVTGPLLLIANHACWWDPLFIAGVLPRPITAMMTASFYDIWHLKPFMKYVVRAIRVPEKSLRFEAPEIHEAIAALDRGECVVIFPEGYLRRKEEVPLRRFGRGVHEILKARPNTPVVAAWIEGAWGSWCSWKDGPPTKNKRIDFRRKIEVGLAAPITVPASVLENHWLTRVFLMNAVSRARTQVGLEPFPEFSVPMKGDTEESLR